MEKKRNLTVEKIVAEAVSLADAERISALSMRRLAAALGVEAASLYNHLAGKEALLDQMVEAVLAEAPPSQQGADWRGSLRALYLAEQAALMRHPWASMLFVSRPNMGPAMLARIERVLAVLTGAGFSLIEADHVWNALDSLLHGFTLVKLNFPLAPEDYAEQAALHAHLIPVEVFPNLRGLADLVAARRHDGLQEFSFALDLLLSALRPGRQQEG
ncbi:TetR/AcrR family transcriptional regulator [Phaeovulum sp.]|uniref:TetR/AcrR family transcriptional regulator n=1 Tax=Phaeovulum sp. TaxID=2934796 RepID=UPI002730FDE0|nr:TetR/AcrR family transcriptional regulator [Phaeovulum sp.]MDP1667410.1 TetR/AcrR family transcriptional regulator [Phaeovulum sp.]MDZ4119927.1 TetR/AcrR family transcriptional regulator [Phaeovulum sp.]